MSAGALTLYAVEERLAALIGSEDVVPEELLAEYLADLAQTNEAALDKRDNCVHFFRHVEAQITFAKDEEKRVAKWRKSLEAGLKRFEDYLARVIEENVPMPKRGPRKLMGRVGELALCKSPDAVKLEDEAKVPACYKRAEITMPYDLWLRVLEVVEFAATKHEKHLLSAADVLAIAGAKVKTETLLTPIKGAIEANATIPGADLEINRYRLEVR